MYINGNIDNKLLYKIMEKCLPKITSECFTEKYFKYISPRLLDAMAFNCLDFIFFVRSVFLPLNCVLLRISKPGSVIC